MSYTKIDWCDWTWNPVWGCKNNCCTPFGEPYCYARKINAKHPRIKDFSNPELMPERLHAPFPHNVKLIFVNAMSDISYWKEEWLGMVMERIKENPDKVFIFLTKNYRYYQNHLEQMDLPNVILGMTATCQQQYDLVCDASITLFNNVQRAKLLLNVEPIFDRIPETLFVFVEWDWVVVGALKTDAGYVKITEWDILGGLYGARKKRTFPVFFKDSMLFQELFSEKEPFCRDYIPGMESYKKKKSDKEFEQMMLDWSKDDVK